MTIFPHTLDLYLVHKIRNIIKRHVLNNINESAYCCTYSTLQQRLAPLIQNTCWLLNTLNSPTKTGAKTMNTYIVLHVVALKRRYHHCPGSVRNQFDTVVTRLTKRKYVLVIFTSVRFVPNLNLI